MSDKYMVSQTIKYSDGSETTLNYKANENMEEIETTVAEAVAETSPEEEIIETSVEQSEEVVADEEVA